MNTPVASGPPPAAGHLFDTGARSPPSRRWRIFLLVFAVVAVASLAADYLRPAIYRSGATLLVEAPASQTRATPLGDGAATAGTVMLAAPPRTAQLLATEQQRLLSTSLLQTLAEEFGGELASDEQAADPLAALQTMTHVNFDATTSLLDVGVEGRNPELLRRVLERWLTLYEASRSQTTALNRDSDDQSLRGQVAALDEKIAAQRAGINAFRTSHGIVSEERAENSHAAKLNGLNDSINKAADDEMRAAARLEAIRAANAAGRPVAEGQNLAAIERLQAKVETLRDTVRAQGDQFTEKFAQIAPEIMAARKDLAQAEQDLVAMRERTTNEVLSKAETDLASAREARSALMRQQVELRGEMSDFSRRFDELTSMRSRLAELETQAAPLRERLVQTEVAADDLAPRVTVLAAPSLPGRPVRPAYARDAAIGLGAALTLALLVTMLVEFLTRSSPAAVHAAVPSPHIYSLNTQLFPPPGGAPALPGAGPEAHTPASALPALAALAPRARELAPEEVAALLRTGDDGARLLVALLLSGVTSGELAELRAGDLTASGELLVGVPPRRLLLAPVTRALWERHSATPGERLFAGAAGAPPDLADLQGTLIYVAHDAGLTRPEEVTPDALRHTYFAWLVRHGLKLGELPRIGGALAPAAIATYAALAPPGAGRALEQVDAWYPVLAERV